MKNLFRKLGGMFLGLAMLSGVFITISSEDKTNAVEAGTWTRCTAVSDLTSGGTFIIGYEATAKSGTLVPMQNQGTATTSAAGYLNSGSTSSSSVNTTITMSSVVDTSLYEVTIGASSKVDGAIFIKIGSSFLGNTNTKNNCKLFESEATTTSFTPTVGTNDVFTLKISANVTYHTLQYNSGSPRFAVYGGTQKNLVIYKKPASGFTVTYNANNATSGSVPTDSTSYASGASVTVLGNTGSLTRTGYSFGGWNSNSAGTGTDYAVGSSFEITENKTLYAKWIEKTLSSVDFTSDAATKTDYFDGEKYSAAGLKLLLTYSDASTETIPIDDADTVTIYPEYASIDDTYFLVEATINSVTTSESKEVEVTVSENTMSLTWNDNFSTYTYLRDDQITSELIGTIKASWKAATQEHEKIKDLVFGTDYALGLYTSRSDSSSSTNTPKIIIDSLPYSLTLEARNLYIGASYNGKITFKSTSLTIRNWRSVIEGSNSTATYNFDKVSGSSSISGTDVNNYYSSVDVSKPTLTNSSVYQDTGAIRLATGSKTGSITFNFGTNKISSIQIKAKGWSSSETACTMSITNGGSITTSKYDEFETFNVNLSSKTSEITFTCNPNNRIRIGLITFTINGELDIGKTEKCLGLEEFIETNMHMSDYTTELGYCKDTEHHYYSTAKAAFNDLTAEQRTLFNENDAYTDEHNRLVAWAAANGEIINSSNLLDQASSKQLLASIVDSSNSTLIIVIISLTGLTAIGSYFFYKKHKEN